MLQDNGIEYPKIMSKKDLIDASLYWLYSKNSKWGLSICSGEFVVYKKTHTFSEIAMKYHIFGPIAHFDQYTKHERINTLREGEFYIIKRENQIITAVIINGFFFVDSDSHINFLENGLSDLEVFGPVPKPSTMTLFKHNCM
jgi:hypothetical protein